MRDAVGDLGALGGQQDRAERVAAGARAGPQVLRGRQQGHVRVTAVAGLLGGLRGRATDHALGHAVVEVDALRERGPGVVGVLGPRARVQGAGRQQEQLILEKIDEHRALGHHRLAGLVVLRVEGVGGPEVDEADADLVAGVAGDADERVPQRNLLIQQRQCATLVATDDAEGALLAEDREVHVRGDRAALAGRDAQQAVAVERLEHRTQLGEDRLEGGSEAGLSGRLRADHPCGPARVGRSGGGREAVVVVVAHCGS